MLRKREIELIAALVEGSLEDESEARALIAGSDEARAEYEAQKLAFETLSSAEPERLTDQERSALRRDLWTVLQADPAPAPRTTPWYYRWAPVAAGLLLVVGLVAVLTQEAGESGVAETFNEIAADLADEAETETTTAASETTESGDIAQRAQDGAATLEEEDAPEEAAAPLAADSPEFFERVASEVRSGEVDESIDGDDTDADTSDFLSCIEAAGLGDHEVFGETADLYPDEPTTVNYLIVVPSGVEIGPDTPVAFVTADTCEVAYVDE